MYTLTQKNKHFNRENVKEEVEAGEGEQLKPKARQAQQEEQQQ